MSEPIIEPSAAAWRSGDLVVRVTVEENRRIAIENDQMKGTTP